MYFATDFVKLSRTNCIIVALEGGLGNQLFQYAAARSIASQTQAEIILDLSWFDVVLYDDCTTSREYALAPFSLPVAVTRRRWHKTSRIGHRIAKIAQWMGMNSGLGLCPTVLVFKERDFRFDPHVLDLTPPIRLQGYWQSWKYFARIAFQLREELGTPRDVSPATWKMLEQIRSSDAVCVPVRRGDYVANSAASWMHGLCSLDYYRAARPIAAASLANPHAFVFSDDPAWVRKHFPASIPYTVVDINGADQAHQDLWLMAACRNFVIANSSLSWWGAWLSTYERKIVVCPRKWFASGQHDTQDLIPMDWVRL